VGGGLKLKAFDWSETKIIFIGLKIEIFDWSDIKTIFICFNQNICFEPIKNEMRWPKIKGGVVCVGGVSCFMFAIKMAPQAKK
jgi:hypothetical protein